MSSTALAGTRVRDDIRYGFAVGRVRVLEGRLLSRATFERLLDAPDLKEHKAILAETHVGPYLDAADSADAVERALEASLDDLYDEFLERAGLPDAVVAYFRQPHDYANLRTALKARILGVTAQGTLTSLGTVPPEAFAKPSSLPAPFASMLVAWDEAEEAPDLDDVEAAVDRALFAALAASARASGVRFLRDLTVLRIDLANARVLLRARAKGVPQHVLAGRLIPGGSRSLTALAEAALRLEPAELAEAIIRTGALGHATAYDLEDPERFDVAADLVVAEQMAAARRMPNGPEPVIAYVLAREAEVRVLRTLVAGRLAGLDPESIRPRLRGYLL